MKTFQQIGMELGELVQAKNAAYGSSFAKSADFLRLLYPDGVTPEQYADMLLQVRVFDKQMRIATDRDALGENPWADVSGYGICGVYMHQDKGLSAEERKECDGASDAATSQLKEQHDSAATSASARITTIASGMCGHEPMMQPEGTACVEEFAPAQTVTGHVSQSAAANQNVLSEAIRNLARELYSKAEDTNALRDAQDLLLALSGMLDGKSLHGAFGAPGDWGYETPIGKALALTYSKMRKAK